MKSGHSLIKTDPSANTNGSSIHHLTASVSEASFLKIQVRKRAAFPFDLIMSVTACDSEKLWKGATLCLNRVRKVLFKLFEQNKNLKKNMHRILQWKKYK